MGDGVGLILDFINSRRRANAVQDIVDANKKASAIVESYREGLTGEPSRMLDERRFQDYMQNAERSTPPQNGPMGSQVGTPQFTRPYKSGEEALAALDQVPNLRPGTPAFKEYVDQINSIKTEHQLKAITPLLAQHYGIDPSTVNESTLSVLAKMRDQDIAGKSIVKREALTSSGQPGVQTGFADEFTGRFTPITIAGPGGVDMPSPVVPRPQRQQAGSLMMMDENGKPMMVTGDAAILEKAFAGQTGRQAAIDMSNLKAMRGNVDNYTSTVNRLLPIISSPTGPSGPVGERLGELRSLAINAGKAAEVIGLGTGLKDAANSFDSSLYSESGQKSAKQKIFEYSLAKQRAIAENPNQKLLRTEDVKRGLIANGPIFNGPPEIAIPALRELTTTIIQGYNIRAAQMGQPKINPMDAAPELYRLDQKPIVRSPDDVNKLRAQGHAMNSVELKELYDGLGSPDPAERLRVRNKYKGRAAGLDLGGQ